MAAENHSGGRSPRVDPAVEDHHLDNLARGLARGSISRRKAMRWIGGALLGSVLAIVPGVEAIAAPTKPPHQGRCPAGFVNCRGTCVRIENNPSHCGGCNIQCSQGETCCSGQCANLCSDPNNCGACGNACSEVTGLEGAVCVGCGSCGCPIGTNECNGACVSDICPIGQAFNPFTCLCEPGGCTLSSQATCSQSLCGEGGLFGCFCLRALSPINQLTCACVQSAQCAGLQECSGSSDCPTGYACVEGCPDANRCVPFCSTEVSGTLAPSSVDAGPLDTASGETIPHR